MPFVITLEQPYAHKRLYQENLQSVQAKQHLVAQFFNEHSFTFHGLSVTDLSFQSEFNDKQIEYWSMHHYNQHFKGIEVFGGELKVRFDHNGHITSLNGVLLNPKELSVLNTDPKIDEEAAKSSCLALMSSLHPEQVSWTIESHSGLVIFKHGLTGYSKDNSVHLAYKMVVESSDPVLLGFEVLVDAHNGNVLSHVSTIRDALHRQIRGFNWQTLNISELIVEWDESAPVHTANEMYQNMLLASKTVYTLFNNLIGYDSFDNNGNI